MTLAIKNLFPSPPTPLPEEKGELYF